MNLRYTQRKRQIERSKSETEKRQSSFAKAVSINDLMHHNSGTFLTHVWGWKGLIFYPEKLRQFSRQMDAWLSGMPLEKFNAEAYSREVTKEMKRKKK